MTGEATLLRGARVLTCDDAGTTATAMAIAGGEIVAVGDEAEVRSRLRGSCRELDLGGATVVPGFIDAHNHLGLVALGELGVDCRDAASVEEICDRIGARAAATPAGGWIRAVSYDEARLAEGRHPTRWELDRAAPDHPVVLAHVSVHQVVANTAALDAFGLAGAATPDPPGGIVVRDRRGRPTGVLLEAAGELVDAPVRRALLDEGGADVDEALLRVCADHLRRGITQVCDPGVDPSLRPVYARLRDRMGIRLHTLAVSGHGLFAPPDEAIAEGAVASGPSGVKFFTDGAEQCAMCMSGATIVRSGLIALGRSLATRDFSGFGRTRRVKLRRSDGRYRSGVRFYDDAELADRMVRAAQRGLTVAVHALGNEAVDQALGGFERVRREVGDAPLLRMEHAMVPDVEALQRIADLGVVVVTQPSFVADFGDGLRAIGIDTCGPAVPVGDLLRCGATVAGSSDAPVTVPDVLAAVQSAVDRRTRNGALLSPDEAVTAHEALGLYTRGAAAALGVADRFGSLQAGRAADFVVLDGDPTGVPTDRIGDLEVLETWVAGERLYRSSSDDGAART